MNAARSILPRAIRLAAVGAALAASASAATFTREEIREFDSTGIRKLTVEVDSGDILISGSAAPAIAARIVLTTRASKQELADKSFANTAITVEQSGDSARISIKSATSRSFFKRLFGPPSASAKVVLQCPSGIDLAVTTGAGDFIVQNLQTNLAYRSGAGNASISGFAGTLDLTSGAGDINAAGAIRAFTAKSGAGDISIISSVPLTADSKASSGAGDVAVRLPPTAAFALDASTGVGSVTCEFPLDPATSAESRKSLQININGPGPALVLKSGAGDVALRQGPQG